MRANRIGLQWIGAGVALLLAMLLAGLVVSARQRPLQTVPRPAQWWLASPAIQADCGQAKQATDEAYTRAEATFAAQRPTFTPLGTQLTTPTAPPFDPVAIPTPHAVDPIEFVDGDSNTRGSNSIWAIGILPTRFTGRYSHLYVFARPPSDGSNATISTAVLGNNASEAEQSLYNRGWICPEAVGRITITSVPSPTTSTQGLTGIIYFSTQNGKTGSFDLGQAIWSFDPTPE